MTSIVLETDLGSRYFAPAELCDDDIVILEDGPAVWDQPWAAWQSDWQLIGTYTWADQQCALVVVRIADPESRFMTQLRWPTRSLVELFEAASGQRHEHARAITAYLQRTKTPPKSQNGQVDQ